MCIFKGYFFDNKEDKMYKTLMILACLLFVLSMNSAMAQNPEKKNAAVASANAWLKKVDSGQYTASWDTAALYFKNAVSQAKWEQSLNAIRKPLGNVVSRTVKNTTYTTSLPGAPDGEYVVIQYNTTFANKKNAIETVTPMLDKGNEWRVSGYYIK
jgi:hypothetical protein